MTREGNCDWRRRVEDVPVNNINHVVTPIGNNIRKCLNCEIRPMLLEPTSKLICEGFAGEEDDRYYTGSKLWDLCLDCHYKLAPNEAGMQMNGYWNRVGYDIFMKKYWKIYQSYGILKPVKKKAICLWYSVRPPNEIDEEEFIKRMEKFIESNSITKGFYTFEWKYPDKCTDHRQRHSIHFHGLLYGVMGKVNFHIARQKEKYFHLNKKQKFWIYDEEDIQDKLDYIQGRTIDQTKNAEKHLDKLSRKSLGMADVIEI